MILAFVFARQVVAAILLRSCPFWNDAERIKCTPVVAIIRHVGKIEFTNQMSRPVRGSDDLFCVAKSEHSKSSQVDLSCHVHYIWMREKGRNGN